VLCKAFGNAAGKQGIQIVNIMSTKASKEDILLVEDFLDGKLDKEQLKAFKKRMQADAAFARLVELRTNLQPEYQRAAEYGLLKSKIGNVIDREERPAMGINPVWVISIAATVIILVGIYIIFLTTSSDTDKSNQLTKADSAEMMQMDEPEAYAVKRTLTFTLKSPVLDESFGPDEDIILKWETPETGEADLYIKTKTGTTILINKRIDLAEEQYSLDMGILPVGSYTWYINDTTAKGSFTIAK
jgi:hypothetical protein